MSQSTRSTPIAVYGNGGIKLFKGPDAATHAAAYRATLPQAKRRAAAPKATMRQVLQAIADVRSRLNDAVATKDAARAEVEQPAVEELISSRPDLSPAFAEKLRGRSLAQVERTLAHLPPPSAARQEQQIAMGLLRRTSGGAELQGTKLVFGARRVVRDEASK